MSILGVTYHYVRPCSASVPGLRYLHLDDFKKQLDWLCSERRAIPREEFLAIARKEKEITDGFVLSFDDGLLDHYKFVLPELIKRGLWGSFYIPVGPYVTNRSLDVHLVHALLGVFGGQTILQHLENVVKELGINTKSQNGRSRYASADDDTAILEVKRKLNYDIDVNSRSEAIDKICKSLNFVLNPQDWYLSTSEMSEMASAGMIIGSHSMSHRPMSQLPASLQESEIHDSFDWIEKQLIDPMVRSFCYPYGGFDTFDSGTESILANAGSLWAFNTEEREILQQDVVERPQALPRIDCCNLPHGKARKYDS